MGRKLRVRNLSHTTTEETLRQLFETIGPVERLVLCVDREKGETRYVAVVVMLTSKAAQECIKRLNNCEVDSRQIVVQEVPESWRFA